MLRASSSASAAGRLVREHRLTAGFLVAVACFLVVPDGSWPQAVAFCALGLVAAALGWRGSRRARNAVAWRWISAGIAANAIGTLVEMLLARVLHSDAFPSVADVFYLSLYVGTGIGLGLLVSRSARASLKTSLLDSSTIAAGAGLLSWIFLIRPLADTAGLSLFGRVVSMAYPLADLVLLALVTRLLLVTALRAPAYRLLFAAVACFLVADTTWGVVNRVGGDPGPWGDKALQVLSLAAYALVAAAAQRPTTGEAPSEEHPHSARLAPAMLATLTVAALTAPAVLALQALHGRVTDGVAIAVGSAVLFLLVIARMAGLLGQVERQAALLRDLALVDELTGLANRRALMADLRRSCEQTQRANETLALAVLDVDHFKQVNDLFGHVEGDRLLAAAAHAWRRRLRGSDLLARYGGEEFVVVMPVTDLPTALRVLHDLQTVTPGGLTFSGGLTTWRNGESCDALITRADEALYIAKARGRDQIVMAADDARPGIGMNRRPSDVRALG